MAYIQQNTQRIEEYYPQTEIVLAYRNPLSYFSKKNQQSQHSNIVLLACLLCLLQIVDGMLTAQGLSLSGIESEGNALLRSMMYLFGITHTLIVVKSLAIGAIFWVSYVAAPHVRWIPAALKSLIVVYTLAAILPWTAILLQSV